MKSMSKTDSGPWAIIIAAIIFGLIIGVVVYQQSRKKKNANTPLAIQESPDSEISPALNSSPPVEPIAEQTNTIKYVDSHPGPACLEKDVLKQRRKIGAYEYRELSLEDFLTRVEPTREFIDAHPVLLHDHFPHAVGEVKWFMGLTDKQVLDLTIDQLPANIKERCPQCGVTSFEFDRNKPKQIKCKKCKGILPSKKYPLNHQVEYLSVFGEKTKLSFHRDAKGELYPIQGYLLGKRFGTLMWNLPRVAYAYHLTGDERYARRVKLVLMKIADNYKYFVLRGGKNGYVSTGGPKLLDGKPRHIPFDHGNKPLPYGWYETLWPSYGVWSFSIPAELTKCFDLVYKSKHFDGRVPGKSLAVREYISREIFDRAASHLYHFPWAAHIHNNLVPQMGQLVEVAHVTNRPELAHFSYRYCNDIMYHNEYIRSDGISLEGPGYHFVLISGAQKAFNALARYSDPPGYVSKADGLRIEHPLPDENAAYVRSMIQVESYAMPNGGLAAIHDCGYSAENPSSRVHNEQYMRPPAKSLSRILPGVGHMVLGGGSGKNQVQAHLQFSPWGNHCHNDMLGLILFAHGRELISDLGYKWDKFARECFAHNLVAVDGKNQKGTKLPEGLVEIYAPDMPGLAVGRVNSLDVYSGKTQRYCRTLLLNTIDEKHPYVLDVFEVTGGSQHDFWLHGDFHQQQFGKCSLPMNKMSGRTPLDPSGKRKESFGVFSNVSTIRTTQAGYVDFVYRDQQKLGLRIHFPSNGDTQLLLGETPTCEKDKNRPQTMPQAVFRRRTNSKGSVFVVVHEPHKGEAVINDLQVVALKEGALGITVKCGERTDRYAVSLRDPQNMEHEGLTTDGIIAVSASRGEACDLWLVGGTKAQQGKRTLVRETGQQIGKVVEVTRQADGWSVDSLVTNIPFPLGSALRGQVVYVDALDRNDGVMFTLGYEIDQITQHGINAQQRRIILEQDSSIILKSDGALTEAFYPYRKAPRHRLRFTSQASTVPRLVCSPDKGRYTPLWVNDFVPVGAKQKVKLATVPQGMPIQARLNGKTVAHEAGISLAQDSDLVVELQNPRGVMVCPVEKIRFLPQLPANKVDRNLLEPGLRISHYGKKEYRTPEAQRNLDQETPDKTVPCQTFQVKGKHRRGQRFEGYLDVPEDGLYTFTTQADGVILKIDGVTVVDACKRSFWTPWNGQVALKKGLHRLQVDHFVAYRSADRELRIHWCREGQERTALAIPHLFRRK